MFVSSMTYEIRTLRFVFLKIASVRLKVVYFGIITCLQHRTESYAIRLLKVLRCKPLDNR